MSEPREISLKDFRHGDIVRHVYEGTLVRPEGYDHLVFANGYTDYWELLSRPEPEKPKHKYAVGTQVRVPSGFQYQIEELRGHDTDGEPFYWCEHYAKCSTWSGKYRESELTPIEEPEKPKWTPEFGDKVEYDGGLAVITWFRIGRDSIQVAKENGKKYWAELSDLTPWEDER